MRCHIIVSGIPASGKSTVGRMIAAALDLPLLDKDEFLETMFDEQGVGDAQWRTRLSRAADDVLREKALRSDSAVITSWWCHPASHVESGTPVEWLSSLPGILIELYCICSPQIAAERFLSRKRHQGHLDHSKARAEVLASFAAQAALGALGIAPVVKVNTERDVNLNRLLAEVDLAAAGDRVFPKMLC